MATPADDGGATRAHDPRTDHTDGTLQRVVPAEALGRLTTKQGTVLVLRYYEDLTEQQAAALMAVRVGTVKSQTRHALLRLRQVAPDLLATLEDLVEQPVEQPDEEPVGSMSGAQPAPG